MLLMIGVLPEFSWTRGKRCCSLLPSIGRWWRMKDGIYRLKWAPNHLSPQVPPPAIEPGTLWL